MLLLLLSSDVSCRQEAPVALPTEVLAWHCVWPWDWHLASTEAAVLHRVAWGDQRLWVSPGQSRVGGSSLCQALGDMFHLLLRPPPSEAPSVPRPAHPADGSGSQPCPGGPSGSA